MVGQCRPLDGMSISFGRCPVPQYISIPSVIPKCKLASALEKLKKNEKVGSTGTLVQSRGTV